MEITHPDHYYLQFKNQKIQFQETLCLQHSSIRNHSFISSLKNHERNKKSTTCEILETGSQSASKVTPTARNKDVSIPNALSNFSYSISKLL